MSGAKMFLKSIEFIGAFPDGDKTVSVAIPNGTGGNIYHLMIDNYYYGIIVDQLGGWRVAFQIKTDQYCMGDLQPLIDLVSQSNE